MYEGSPLYWDIKGILVWFSTTCSLWRYMHNYMYIIHLLRVLLLYEGFYNKVQKVYLPQPNPKSRGGGERPALARPRLHVYK